MGRTYFRLLRLLSLKSDQATHADIDAAIRDNARLGGTNLWVLIFAIFIASVGLNVNSTAVIIGAMLISPLMGPIIGIGYGASIHDYAFIRQSFRNLGVFIAISLLTSSFYFLITPLTVAHSELLARTSPTLWDVLIAFFGGAAGMVGLTRREKNTLIPGVAIATALMPPLCTVGFGIATQQPQFFLGAAYLFLINAVFIALATLAIARVLRLPEHSFPDEATRRRGRLVIGGAIALTLVPSIYLAYGLVSDEVFTSRATRFVREVALHPTSDVVLVRKEIDPKTRSITLFLIGKGATPTLQDKLNLQLTTAGLKEARLTIKHPSEDRIDLASLRSEISKDVLQSVTTNNDINVQQIAMLEARLAEAHSLFNEVQPIEREIMAQLPALRAVKAAVSISLGQSETKNRTMLIILDAPKKISASELARLKRWLIIRMPEVNDIHLVTGQLSGTSESR